MNTATLPVHPAAEVLLRVRLVDIITPAELGVISEIAKQEGSLDAAVTKALKAGLKAITPARKPKRKGMAR